MQAMHENENPTECCPDLKAKFDEWKTCAERSVREEPLKTAGAAFAAGVILTVLPVGRIVEGVLRLAFALVRPALLVLGVVKIAEVFEKQRK